MIKRSCTVMCIDDFIDGGCSYYKGHIYKLVLIDIPGRDHNMRLYENEHNYITYHSESFFNGSEITPHFKDINEDRKLKIEKINSI